ncbi:MAG TPA: choice-of-anchor J domain-containing protein, partial [Tenuifilaceae bacterium]|nr:choice-of-anchor J domain-containing protein [Tenuifilaceae bacterium]
HNYKVTKEGFISVSGVVEVVDQDVTVNVTLLEGLVFELPFAEVFDGEGAETPATWLPDGWSAVDNDGDTYNWFWNFKDSDENGSMLSESYHSETQDELTPDNWLITPAIDLSTEEVGVKLTFKVAPTASSTSYVEEHYSVLISTTNTNSESFESLYSETLPSTSTGWVYVQKEIDLTEYKGNVVYIAFRHHDVTNMNQISLDDINVFATGIGVETEALANLVAYPNPFSDYITVKSETKVSRVIVTNLIGQTIMNLRMDGTEGMISTSNLPRGIYLITFEGENGDRVVRKMIKE